MSLARTLQRLRNRNKKIPAMRHKVHLEPLEPRLLLSSDLAYTAAAGTALDATLRLQKVDDVDTLQLINNIDQSVLQSQALAETSGVNITGADLDDKLTIDFSSPFSVSITFADTSADDSDRLEAVGRGNTWDITASNKGRIRGGTLVDFEAIENLLGGSDADTFIFWEAVS